MHYSKIEKLGIETSLLGFGCMRFPLDSNGKIDEAESEKMIDKAIASGVNYIDTAYPYHDGDSEPFVGRVLDKYDRKTYYLATKLPTWDLKTPDDAKRIFEDQLKRLNKDYVDFYLLHALDIHKWKKVLELGVLDYCEELKRQGKIKYLGFSFHDSYKSFEEIATYRDWDFCQIQLNYMDTDIQAGIKGYELTEKLNIPLVIMEPIKGGSLATLPKDITDIFKAANEKNSVASWALRWVGSFPNVKTILSGMSTYEQVLDNLDTFEEFKLLDEAEKQVVDNVAEAIRNRIKNGCTKCRYCMPCPAGVNIPRNFTIWNNYSMYENKGEAKWQFSEMNEKEHAKNCIKCGKCEKVCPQGISIRNDLEEVAKVMEDIC